MSLFRQLLVYVKVTLIAVVFFVVALLIFKNRSYQTKFWPFADEQPLSTLWLMLLTAVTSIIAFWVLSRTYRVMKEVAQLRAERAMAARAAEQEKLRKHLDDQERRIDEKLKRAVGEENSQP